MGAPGINLYIDRSGTVPFFEVLSLDGESESDETLRNLRAAHLTPKRWGAFHHAVWGQGFLNEASGASNVGFDSGKDYGDSFVVTLGAAGPEYQTVRAQAETFIHELGHNLGQRHGGETHFAYKPTYFSDMAYTWVLRVSAGPSFRKQAPTCATFYYGRDDVDEAQETLASASGVVIDYSQGMGPTLPFSGRVLSEKQGLCGRSVDWDGDGAISNDLVEGRLYEMPREPPPWTFADFANWGNLHFDGLKNPIWGPK